MGAGRSGPACCESFSTTCCAKATDGHKTDLARAQQIDFPGLPKSDFIPLVEDGKEGKADEAPDSADADGNCEETYEDGSTYKGQIVEGKRHGKGVWQSATEQYSGQWMDDQRHGEGRQVWQDGRIFEGQFHDGKFSGHGRMEWHTPAGVMIYEGQYDDDLKHGHGKYVWPDNRVYEGGWCQGKRSGTAKYTSASGEKREGIWKDDKVERWLDEAGDRASATTLSP